MANTFSQIYLQFVFAVRGRRALVPPTHKEELHKYITSLVQCRHSKMLAVHCMPDHTHLFVGLTPVVFIPDFIKEIKVQSHAFIKERQWVGNDFSWQDGYGVFSYSHSHIDRVIKYILNQEEHHRKNSFQQEHRTLLKKFEVQFQEKYLFEFLE